MIDRWMDGRRDGRRDGQIDVMLTDDKEQTATSLLASCVIQSVLTCALLKKRVGLVLVSFRGVLSFFEIQLNVHQRACPRAEGGRGVGAFIFDKVHLQVSPPRRI